tara:strand:- start:2703 stop:3806 length:1104 start_codon:yes stop_codon:yes gene_type:complete
MISLKNIGKKAIVTLAMLIVLKGNVLSNSSKPIDINQIYLTSCVNNEICSTESKDVTLENKVKLNLVVEASQDGKKLYFSNIDNIKINGSKINSSFIKQWNAKDTLIRWFKVESQKNNYDNGGNENFHWDKIKYKETLIDNGNKWVLQADGSPTDKSKDINDGLGTMRYKVEVRYNGKKISSPGKESTNSKGIEDKVHRISFRKDNSFVGWLTSYFNLPYIYASSGKNNKEHQTEKYIGSDCADLIVGAYRKTGRNIPYTYAAGLTKFADIIIDEKNLYTGSENYYNYNKPLKFGSDVKIGDLILFGKWHVGAIVEDKSNPNSKYKGAPDGLFNKYDMMVHTLFNTPVKESIGEFGGGSILRWKNEK